MSVEIVKSQVDSLLKTFVALNTNEEKAAFLHDPANKELLRVINPVHFPKPEKTATAETA